MNQNFKIYDNLEEVFENMTLVRPQERNYVPDSPFVILENDHDFFREDYSDWPGQYLCNFLEQLNVPKKPTLINNLEYVLNTAFADHFLDNVKVVLTYTVFAGSSYDQAVFLFKRYLKSEQPLIYINLNDYSLVNMLSTFANNGYNDKQVKKCNNELDNLLKRCLIVNLNMMSGIAKVVKMSPEQSSKDKKASPYRQIFQEEIALEELFQKVRELLK